MRAVLDAMPADAGRNVTKLAAISRATGVHIVVATGLHHARYYGERHWGEMLDPDELADLFAADVTDGVDALDYGAPVVRRTPHRAGVVKVAGSAGGLTERDRRLFAAAALAARRTGVAVLTHCEAGEGGLEQVEVLAGHGVDPGRIVLSHTDKVADLGYHRALLDTGAYVVYDQGIRTPDGTERLVLAAVEAGYADQVLLGTDGARRSLWRALGGSPGLVRPAHRPGRPARRRARPCCRPAVGGQPGPRSLPSPRRAPRDRPARRAHLPGHRGHRDGRRRRPPVRHRGRAVVVVDRDEAHCTDLGLPYVVADLTGEEATQAAFARARELLPRLDAAYAVAGGSGRRYGDGPAHAVDLAAWRAPWGSTSTRRS